MTAYHDHDHVHDHVHPYVSLPAQPSSSGHPISRRRMITLLSGAALALVACDGKDTRNEPSTPASGTPGPSPSSPSSSATPTASPVTPGGATRSLDAGGPFSAFPTRVRTRTAGGQLYVESDGMPDHPMMIGIRSWQQQVPLPQPYTGSNAWSVPLEGVLSNNPVSAKTALYRGAIALAANGVPIFNALNNRGDDALLAGELDQWGGHSGRADDYHYHVAPLHLQSVLGAAAPIAYALDGFPLYGLTEPDGSPVSGLDEFNGHLDGGGRYHYHATLTYPYINGGMRGVVQVRDDQVDPQPAAAPVRPALTPLRGATITGFKTLAANRFSLEYQVDSQVFTLNYGFEGNTYTFEFVDPSGGKRTETYARR